MLSRRSFFGAAGLTAAGLLTQSSQILKSNPLAFTELGKVKITDIKTAVVKIKKYNTTLVKVTTDQGIFGIGEAFPKVDVVGHINDVKKEDCGDILGSLGLLKSGQTLCVNTKEGLTVAIGGEWEETENAVLEWRILD